MWRSSLVAACVAAVTLGGCAGKTEAGGTGGGAGLDGGAGTTGTGGTSGGGGYGATGGTGGVVSNGGTGGGAGATSCNTGTPQPPACGAALCGNGKIDTCNNCPDGGFGGYPGGGPPCQSNAENCDGTVLGGASCTSLGFPGGTLSCGADCRFDTSACVRCSALGGHLTGCSDSVADASSPSALAVAATAQEIGVAWISRSASGPGVWFARFKPDLTLIAKSGPLAADCPQEIALATRPGGWDIATSGYGHSVELFALDATGKVTDKKVAAVQGHGAVFGERASGGPLLAWIDAGSQSLGAVVVSADGISTTTAASIPMPSTTVDRFMSAAFVGNGFLVAVRSGSRVVVGRVGTDGTTSGAVTQPVPAETEVPALASAGNEARMVYEHFAQPITVEMVRLDQSGHALAKPVVLGGAPNYYNNAYPVADGADTLVVMGSYTGTVYQAKHLDVIRVDGSGQKLWGPQTIATDPTMLTGYGAAMSGSELVSAFIEGGSMYPAGIGLARLTP